MKQIPYLLVLSLFIFCSWKAPIQIDNERIGDKLASHAVYLEDPNGAMSLDEVLEKDAEAFTSIEKDRANFGFTNSAYWIRFELENSMEDEERFFILPSRPLTNKVEFYRFDEEGALLDSMHSGDHVRFSERPFPNRHILFPIDLKQGEKASIYLRMKGKGEVLLFPLEVWTLSEFVRTDHTERLLLGLFFGILLFVVLIFAFFYFSLREHSFLYYFLYVLAFATLQFALEGFAYRYFFPNAPWYADRAIPVMSCVSVFLVTQYARHYLRVWNYDRWADLAFKGIMGLAVLGFIASLTNGILHRLAYPYIYALSFFGTLFILGAIVHLRYNRGLQVSKYFVTAFVLLISGVALFLLGDSGILASSPFTVHGLKIGALGEVIFLSFTMAEKYRELQREKEEAQKDSLQKLEELNQMKDAYNKELEETVRARTNELEEEREKLEETNREIISSIRYAQRIQNAILPPDRSIEPMFKEHFVFYRPRDIVSGDIYWFTTLSSDQGAHNEKDPLLGGVTEAADALASDGAERTAFAAVDCTGHGVPGAFLSILGHDILNRSLGESSVNTPAEALDFLDRGVRRTFEMSMGRQEEVKDGMDLSLCVLDHKKMKLWFAGAQNGCYIVRDGELFELKGDKRSIGEKMEEEGNGFTDRSFDLREGDAIYLFSDGYPDQFGGPKGKKFKYKPFKRMLTEISHEEMQEQLRIIEQRFDEWKGDREQVDDVMVIGLRV